MRTIKYTAQFKRDYKREKRRQQKNDFEQKLSHIIELLALDKHLPERMYDHRLFGNWKDHRDCHVKPDLVLIYRKPDTQILELVRLGSHSELGL